jgi:threonine aldolase
LAHRRGLGVHLDGARVFNASIALGVDVRELTRNVDSVSFCLSKGLSAPVGSVLCGDAPFIAEARRWRKAVGGGMRQCGVIAAAGIVALEEMVERLAEDHENAHLLAESIAGLPGIVIDPETVRTDIVIFQVLPERLSAAALVEALRDRGIRMSAFSATHVRAVTHYGITSADIKETIAAMTEITQVAYRGSAA